MRKADNKKDNGYIGRMDYLFNMLHEAWSHSGQAKKMVLVRKSDTDKVVAALIDDVGIMLEIGESINDFKEGIEMSHDMHIMYRMSEKIRKQAEKIKNGSADRSMVLSYDKEEYKMFVDFANDNDIDFWEM